MVHTSSTNTNHIPCRCAVLLMLLLFCSLCSAQTTGVLSKARRVSTAVSSTGGKLKAGVRATGRLTKQAAGTAVTAGLKGGRLAVEAGSTVRRASQRTWEGAKAARAKQQALHVDAFEQQQQQQQQQAAVREYAQKLNVMVFPPADPAAPPSSGPPPPPAAAAAAAVGGLQVDLAGECKSAALPGCGVGDADTAVAAKAGVAEEKQKDPQGVAEAKQKDPQGAAPATHPTKGPGQQQQVQKQHLAAPSTAVTTLPAEDGSATDLQHAVQRPSRGWSSGWVLLSHALAFMLGWVLRGSQQQHRPSDPANPSPAPSGTSQLQQQQVLLGQQAANPGGGAGSSGSSSSSSSNNSSSSAPAAAAAAQRRGQQSRAAASPSQVRQGHTPIAAAAPAGEQQHDSNDTQPAPAAEAVDPAPPAAFDDENASSDAESYVAVDSQDGTPTAENTATGATIAAPVAPRTTSYGRAHVDRQLRRRRTRAHSIGAVVPRDRRLHAVARRPVAAHHELLQLQQQAGHPIHVVGQQTMIITHNHWVISDEVAKVLLPVATVLQEVGCHLQRLSDVAGRWVGWSDQQDRDQRLAAQQELLDRAGHFGQLLGLVAMGAMALRAGRLWEVHQVCQASMQQPAGWRSWAHQLAGTQSVAGGLRYLHCCCQQLGLYAAGMFLLYLLVRVSWSGSHRRSSTGRPSNSFQLDLLVVKGLLCSLLGAHVVHCLGGAWLPWLLSWLVWCSLQLLMHVKLVNSTHSSLFVVLVAVVVPLFTSWAPFRPGAIEWHGWAIETFPFINQSPSLGQLIPW